MRRKDSCGVAEDIAMQEGRDRGHEDRKARRRLEVVVAVFIGIKYSCVLVLVLRPANTRTKR